jgi:hypothetical protein
MRRLGVLFTIAALTLPLTLSGCSEQTGSPEGSNKPAANTGQETTKSPEGEAAFVTALDEKKFISGKPNPAIPFPEEEFQLGRKLLLQKKYSEGEKVLKSKLDQAAQSATGQTKLGQYLVRLNNNLFAEGKTEESLKYAILASKIFYNQPPVQRPVPMWFFNVHLRQGLGYKLIGKNAESETHLRKAINVAASAPRGQVEFPWHRLCYTELIDTLERQKKKTQADIVRKDLKEFDATKAH